MDTRDRDGLIDAGHRMQRATSGIVAYDWLDKAWIPNTEGRRVLLLLDDGTTKETSVARAPNGGLHFLLDVPITRVVAWRPL